jgi:mono/diheme cytochrome c family protein/glucose/arabinose dehydrogenase
MGQYPAMHTYALRLLFRLLAIFCLAGLALTAFVSNRAIAQMPAPLANAPEAPRAQNTNSPTTPYLSPEEELKTFDLKPGYSLQLVVSDPVIKEPVVAVFDGNGRMYVAEMRSYMQDIDAHNEMATNSVISLHWSSKHDGNYDQHSIFVSGLMLPRAILPLADSVLVMTTGSDSIWRYWDTNNDGVADRRELVREGRRSGANLEHEGSGLIWAMDNWLYMALSQYRLRLKGNELINEPAPPNFAYWGISQDNYGKNYYVNAAQDYGPVSYETPIIYGGSGDPRDLTKYEGNFLAVWPLTHLGDYQGGARFVRPDGTLNHFTGTAGVDVFRGDRLPEDLRGDVVMGEPVGRMIRRAKVISKEGYTMLVNPYETEKSEFIRSTDLNFRPVNMVTAPDGTLYIVDMYRGIIQEGNWTRPGSYLRTKIQSAGLEKNVGRGRIWRLVHKDFTPGPQPRLLDEKPAQLVARLNHPNGWWRDNAQKLIVLSGDKSVVPALLNKARTDTDHLARIHALWTLEGLDALPPALIREKLADPHPQVRIAAIRASETLYKAGDKSLMPDVVKLVKDPDPSVVMQVVMTSLLLKTPESRPLAASTVANNTAFGVKTIIPEVIKTLSPVVYPPEFTQADRALLARGRQIYDQLCYACHGLDGQGAPLANSVGLTQAPAFTDAKFITGHRDAIISVVLKGLTGHVDGKTYSSLMAPMEGNDDEYIAAVASYVRTSFGNNASMVSTNDVARVRAAFKERTAPWTEEELASTLPQPLPNRGDWKVTASTNNETAALAIDGKPDTRFDANAVQTPGMWFQVELPALTLISGLQLGSGTATNDFLRGYQVFVSADGEQWSEAIVAGHGTGVQAEILFKPVEAKFVRVQTAAVNEGFGRGGFGRGGGGFGGRGFGFGRGRGPQIEPGWSISELQLIQAPPAIPQSLLVKKAEASKFE